MTHIWMKSQDPRLILAEQREAHLAERQAAAIAGAKGALGMRDLRHVTWPTVEHYGHDHGKQVCQLAMHLAQTLRDGGGSHADFSERDLHIIKGVAYFHDLGRTLPWTQKDEGHRERSAELAAKAMALDTEKWVPAHLQEDVCRVIVHHHVDDDGPPPTDPRMIVLWDAECLDAARFAPNTPEGLEVMARRFNRLITPWARDPSIQRRWKEHRGWR